jgi:hypothetical protein
VSTTIKFNLVSQFNLDYSFNDGVLLNTKEKYAGVKLRK